MTRTHGARHARPDDKRASLRTCFEEEPRTKKCQERQLLKGPSFWENTGTTKCIILFEKMDELRGQPRFHDVSALFFFFVFAGLAALGFGAGGFVSSGQGGLRCCNKTTCRGLDEEGAKKGHPKSRKTRKTQRKHEIQENIAIV